MKQILITKADLQRLNNGGNTTIITTEKDIYLIKVMD